MNKYTCYTDGWELGSEYIVYGPDFNEAGKWGGSWDSIEKRPTTIDTRWTVFTTEDTYTYVQEFGGFTDIRIIPNGETLTLYVSPISYIKITAKVVTQTRIQLGVQIYVNNTFWSGTTLSVQSFFGFPNFNNVDSVSDLIFSGVMSETKSDVDTYSSGYVDIPSRGNPTISYVCRTAGPSSSVDNRYFNFFAQSKHEEYEETDDPYSTGGTSGTGGGTGTFSGTGDSIEFPSLPTLSAVSTGFITLFNPSIAEMQNLANYMWSDVFDIGLYKTLFADPMDCILGCSIVPVAVPNGGTKTVNVGNVSTGISMTVAASQYVEVDCGTLNVEEYWGSYLDYDPYTKAEIYLPYCGTHALQVDDIMGKAVHVKYHVDILSGACCAYVKCGGSVMYSFVGQCSSSIPISANDWTNVVNGALTIAASVGSLIATGGASAPMAVGAAAAVTGTIYGGGIKQNVEKSGSMGGTGGMLAVQTPYLILTRPRQALPKKQNTYTGYPSFITTKLSNLNGYTEIDSIRITGVPATDAELNELESILKSGVIF